MRIVFLCGCLEPGQDGVGDYTRRLAAELGRQGHEVNLIALHDRRITSAVLTDTQLEDDQTIPVFRLSSQLSWPERTTKARAYINTVNPGWISLQYVPFSFHDRGLSTQLASVMKQLSAGRSVHIMFHEVWLGLSKQSSRRHIVWGLLQRQLISSLIKACNAPVVHTHTPLYERHLNGLRIQASLLPLFSNIPVVSRQNSQFITDQSNSQQIRFVFFGGIFPNAPIDQFAAEAAAYATKRQKVIDLTIIGRSGPEQAVWISAWRAHGLTVQVLGEQSPAQISAALNQSSIGLSTTPVVLAGKSGSIAAMHAHGLPVLCVAAPWQPRRVHTLPQIAGVTTYTIDHLEEAIDYQLSAPPARPTINDIAAQFVDTLSH